MAKRAVISAGAGGIGLATALRLQGDGFDVIVLDIDDAAGERASAHGLEFIKTDFGDETSIRNAFDGVGPVHTLVNNVGIRGGTGALWDLPIEDVRRTLEINTVSHVLAAQLVIPGMGRSVAHPTESRAGAVSYLAGDDGIGITGVFLDVSGGFE